MPESSVHPDCAPTQPAPSKKRPSGAEYRRRRVAKGLPRNTPSTLRQMAQRRRKCRQRQNLANRDHVAQVKLERGCVDCGYRGHPVALDFDHLPGFEKSMDLARFCSRQNATRKKLDAEMAKCEDGEMRSGVRQLPPHSHLASKARSRLTARWGVTLFRPGTDAG